jgi:hypothetical protein
VAVVRLNIARGPDIHDPEAFDDELDGILRNFSRLPRVEAGLSKRADRERRRLYFYSRSAISRSAAHRANEGFTCVTVGTSNTRTGQPSFYREHFL